MKFQNVILGDARDRQVAERRFDALLEQALVVLRGSRFQFRIDVLAEPAIGERRDGHVTGRQGLRSGRALDQGSRPSFMLISAALASLRASPSCLSYGAERDPTSSAAHARLGDVKLGAGRRYPHAEARHQGVENDPIVTVDGQPLDQLLGEARRPLAFGASPQGLALARRAPLPILNYPNTASRESPGNRF